MAACTDDAYAPEPMDERTFAEFVSVHGPSVRQAVRRKGLSFEDAEDIAQEALTRTWMARRQLHDMAQLRSFAHLVAHRLYVNDVRLNARRTRLSTAFLEGENGTANSTNDMDVEIEHRLVVGSALRGLRDAERTLLIDTDVLGFSTREIEEREGVSAAAVRVRLSRARAALRRELRRNGWSSAGLVPSLFRRVSVRMRTWSEPRAVLWLSPAAQAALVGITTLGVVLGGLDLGAHLPKHVSLPHTMIAAAADASGSVALASGIAAFGPVAAPSGRTGDAAGAGSRKRLLPDPSTIGKHHICVGNTCTGGDPTSPGDALVIHAPFGDREIKQNWVPVCRYLPAQPVVSCHTEGDPQYVTPPPPAVSK